MDTARLTLPHKTKQVKVQLFNTCQNPEVLVKIMSLQGFKMCEKRFRSATSTHPCDLYQSLDACTSRLAQATKFQHLLNAWVCVKSLVCVSQTGIFRVARLFVFIVFPKPGLNSPQPPSALWKLTLSFSFLSWSLIRMSHFLPLHACDCLLLSLLGQRWRFPAAISLLLQVVLIFTV